MGTLYRKILITFSMPFWITLLALGSVVAINFDSLYQNEQINNVLEKTDSITKTFESTARFGDIRYSKFLITSLLKTMNIQSFRVFDVNYREVQKLPIDIKIDVKEASSIFSVLNIKQRDSYKANITTKNSGRVVILKKLNMVNGSTIFLRYVCQIAKFPWVQVLSVSLLTLLAMIIASLWGVRSSKKISNKIDQFALSIVDAEEKGNTSTAPFQELNLIAQTVSDLIVKIKDREKLAAIAQTTQMLSHDVRRPFSMIQGLLGLLKSSTDATKTQQLAEDFTPEIEKAIASVNGMISDIMEVGSTSKDLLTESISLELLIEASLQEIFRYDKRSKVELLYNFNHKHEINVNSLKIIRVFSNIIANAAQAMKQKGQIWFKSKEILVADTHFIEICIGNSGSFIPHNDLKNLFEAFYTKNKKGGTGLGLAIAKKIIEAHRGEIRCESSEKEGVEFYFTLPVSKTKPTTFETILPSSSSEVSSKSIQTTSENLKEKTGAAALEKQLKATIEQLSSPFTILVVDDEPIYQNFINEIIPKSKDFNKLIEIKFAATAEETFKYAVDLKPNIILMDVDLGNDDSNGFEITQKLRKQLPKCKICIHSNRGAFEYQKETIEVGADLFLPKPIGKALLFKLILSEAKFLTAAPSNKKMISNAENSKHIVVIEDNILILEMWKFITDVKQYRYRNPEEYLEAVKEDPNILGNALCMITDYYFDDAPSKFDGLSFAKLLKYSGYKAPIYLCSDSEISQNRLDGIIDMTIPKIPTQAWGLVKSLL